MLRFLIVLIYFSCALVLSQNPYVSCESKLFVSDNQSFAFSDYSVQEIYSGKTVSLDLNSHPWATQFQTALMDSMEAGSNFAGKYRLVQWGCGSSCQAGAVVDLETGFVVPLPESTAVGAAYQLTSSLLILDPLTNIKEAFPDCKPEFMSPRYFVFKNQSFTNLNEMVNDK